jgi:hypothetical protein
MIHVTIGRAQRDAGGGTRGPALYKAFTTLPLLRAGRDPLDGKDQIRPLPSRKMLMLML